MGKFCIVIIIISLGVYSCRRKKDETKEIKPWSKAHSIDYNSEVNAREQLAINMFIEHYRIPPMTVSESGLRYLIYSTTDSIKPLKGQVVRVRLKIETLDRKICYQTDSLKEFDQFELGKGDMESGIQEAITYMRKGERTKCILPSYLGHGLIGDQYIIPPQAILYADIHLIDVLR